MPGSGVSSYGLRVLKHPLLKINCCNLLIIWELFIKTVSSTSYRLKARAFCTSND